MKYIHYGHSEFELNKFEKIKNRAQLNKPEGGLWAKRFEKENMKNLYKSNGYGIDKNKFIVFTIKDDAKILIIDDSKIISELPKVKNSTNNKVDFEKLAEKYDAIEVILSKDRKLYFELYGWDCDSIIIMNPNVVIIENLEDMP